MALKVGELYALLGLDKSPFDKGLADAGSQLQAFGGKMTQAGMALTAGVTVPLVGTAYAAAKAAGEMEMTRVALTTLLGSAKEADKFIRDVQKFAAATPFEFSNLITSSKQLIAFGFEAKQIIPMMTALGNAVASVGGGSDMLDRVILQLGQMKTVGKASMLDLRPIAQAGIKVFDYLAQELGKSKAEIMKQLSTGDLEAEDAINAIFKGMMNDKTLKGMMDNQSKTFLGMISNFMDQLGATLVPLGKPLIEIGKNILSVLTPVLTFVSKLAEAFAKTPKWVQALVVGFVGLLAAAGPLLMVIGSLASGIGAIISIAPIAGTALGAAFTIATGPVGWIIGAVSALVALFVVLYKRNAAFRDQAKSLWKSVLDFIKPVLDIIKKLAEFLKPIGGIFGRIQLGALKAVFSALGFILKGVLWLLTEIFTILEKIATWIARLLDGTKRSGSTLIELLVDAAAKAVQGEIALLRVAKERQKQAKEASEEEAQQVLDELENQRKLKEADRQRRAERIGWLSDIGELWTRGMAGAMKAAEIGPSSPKTLPLSAIPESATLQEIDKTLKSMKELEAKKLRVIQQRLGTYA